MGKKRVHEIAKELNKDSKDIIATLKQHGVEVKSHMSTLSDEEEAVIRKAFAPKPAEKKPEAPAVKKEAPVRKEAPANQENGAPRRDGGNGSYNRDNRNRDGAGRDGQRRDRRDGAQRGDRRNFNRDQKDGQPRAPRAPRAPRTTEGGAN